MDWLDIGCTFDWITPLVAFMQDGLHLGQAADFGIMAEGGFDRGDIKRMLNRHGIKVWGLMYNFTGETLMFTVKKQQAAWANDVLQMYDVPVLYAPKAVWQ